ncbi:MULTISPECIES: hypothetical protein [unclassified Haloarcula]|uniref:hypothetical protein n=1 Tax=unclassified Haloarcula TaxID=2624677 RepID=UPI001785469F|nr:MULTISPECIES: hypothetical protein [unclassified Haloarcula]
MLIAGSGTPLLQPRRVTRRELVSAGGTFDESRTALAVIDGSESVAQGHASAVRTAADERWYHGETRIGPCRS